MIRINDLAYLLLENTMWRNDLRNEIFNISAFNNIISVTVTYIPNLEDKIFVGQIKNINHNPDRTMIVYNVSYNFETL